MIPELTIENFCGAEEGFFSISIKDLLKEKDFLISLPHRTSYFQILMVLEGEGELWIDESKCHCTSGTMFTVSKGQVARFNFEKQIVGYTIFFSEDYIYHYPDDIGWVNNLKLFSRSISPLVKLQEEKILELNKLYEKIEIEFKTKSDFAKNEIILSLLKTFLLVTERIKRTETIQDYNYSNKNGCVTEFRKKLEENYRIAHSVNFYADLLSVTPRKLNQIVTDHLGKPTKKVIEERILLESKRLLVHTDRTVKEIGTSLGFSDPTNFNKFFRKFSKTTPADFRSSIKTVNHNKTALSNHS